MNDAVSFCKAIREGNYDAAGVFADWLEERGDPRGKLLRRRWRRWQKEHAAALAADERKTKKAVKAVKRAFPREADLAVTCTIQSNKTRLAADSFLLYMRDRFSQEMYEASNPTESQAYKDS